MLDELPKDCDRGTKCNAQSYKLSWNPGFDSSRLQIAQQSNEIKDLGIEQK
jgi:hypothetical protein